MLKVLDRCFIKTHRAVKGGKEGACLSCTYTQDDVEREFPEDDIGTRGKLRIKG